MRGQLIGLVVIVLMVGSYFIGAGIISNILHKDDKGKHAH